MNSPSVLPKSRIYAIITLIIIRSPLDDGDIKYILDYFKNQNPGLKIYTIWILILLSLKWWPPERDKESKFQHPTQLKHDSSID